MGEGGQLSHSPTPLPTDSVVNALIYIHMARDTDGAEILTHASALTGILNSQPLG